MNSLIKLNIYRLTNYSTLSSPDLALDKLLLVLSSPFKKGRFQSPKIYEDLPLPILLWTN